MGKVEIKLPSMGEGITEASITKLLKKIGDIVEIDEPLIEVATDKVDSEIVASHKGKIEKFFYKEGDVVPVGKILVILLTNENGMETVTSQNTDIHLLTGSDEEIVFLQSKKIEAVHENNILFQSKTPGGKILSPLVRSIAKQENISVEDIENIEGSGLGNRITKSDILSYLENGKKINTDKNENIKDSLKTKYQGENFELIEMDRMRKLIAGHMIESKRTSPHVTSFVEVDVTNMVNWRNKVKDEFSRLHGEKITFTPLFIEAIVKAIKEYPMINVSVEGSTIIVKKDINIGMATALKSGNLIVPVIKKSAELNLLGITKKVNDLAERARNNKLKPDEIQGGTFTVTNVGTFGNITGTPIINQPEVAILAVGVIKKRAAVIETPLGDTIGIRQMMIMSMSYDHRVVDGALGGMFLKRVADIIEDFDENRDF